MGKKARKILLWTWIAIFAFLLLFVLLYSYTTVVDKAVLRLVNIAVDHGIQIHYDRLEGNLLGTVKLTGVRISSETMDLRCRSITSHHTAADFLDGFFNIKELVLDSVSVVIRLPAYNADTTAVDRNTLNQDTLLVSLDLSGFPRVRVGRFFLKDATIRLESEDGENHFRNLSLEAEATVNDEKVDVRLKYLRGFWEEKSLNLQRTSFHLTGSKKRLTLNQFETKLDGALILAHGEIELLPKFRFLVFADTSRCDLSLIKKFAPDIPYREGYLKFYGDFIGNLSDFTGTFFLNSRADSLSVGRFSFDYHFHRKTVTIKKFRFQSNFGSLSGESVISPVGKNKLDLFFSRLNLHKIGFATQNTSINGQLKLDFNTWNLKQISGTGWAFLKNIEYGKIRFDTLSLKIRAQKGNWELRKGSRLVVQKASRFFVDGTLSRDQKLNLNLTTNKNNLDTLGKHLDLDFLRGSGSLDVLLSGSLRNPDIFGYFLLDSLGMRSVMSYGVEGRFELIGLLRERIGYFSLDLLSGQVANVMLTDGNVALKINRDVVSIDSISFYNEDNFVGLDGRLWRRKDRFDLQLYHLNLQYENYRIFAADTLKASLISDSLVVDDFVLHALGGGEIEVRGMVGLGRNYDLGIYFSRIALTPFNQFIPLPNSFDGVVEIEIQVSGPQKQVEIETDLDIRDLRADEQFLGNISGNLTYRDQVVTIEKFAFRHSPDSYLRALGKMHLGEFFETNQEKVSQNTDSLTLSFRNLQLSDYLVFHKFNFPVKGRFSGDFSLKGSLYHPELKYRLIGNDMQFQDYWFPSVDFRGIASDAKLTLTDGLVNFMGSEIHLDGYKNVAWNPKKTEQLFADSTFVLNVTIDEDSLNFLSVLTPEADLLAGKIHLNAHLAGRLSKPEITDGRMEVSNGTLYLSKVENPVSNLQLSGEIRDHILRIDHCTAKMIEESIHKNLFQKLTDLVFYPVRKIFFRKKKESFLALNGTVNLEYIDRPRLDLDLTAKRVFVNYYLENAKMLISADHLKISGRDTISVVGGVSILRGEVDLDLEESEKNLLLSPGVRETPPYMHYLLDISIPANFFVRSEATFNAFEVQLEGDISVIQEPKGLLEVYGTLNIPSGNYFQFENFDVREGKLEFTNPKELPKVNLTAEKRKYGYRFELRVSGSLNNPVKEIKIFDSETGEDKTYLYPETKDQIALLLFGVTFNELSSGTGKIVLEKGQEVLSQTIMSQIEREARRFIGLDEVRLESGNNTNQRLNQASEETKLSLGKYLTPNLYLQYKTSLNSAGLPGLGDIPKPSLSWESGDQLFLEYRINRNWSISTFYEKQENDKFKIDIKWRLNF